MQSVNVVVPSRGRVRRLAECLESLTRQTYPHLNVTLVDDNDAQSPFTPEVKRVARGFDSELQLQITRTAGGVGAAHARNQGVSARDSDLVTFLDDDDTYEPEKVEAQVKALAGRDVRTLVWCGLRYYDDYERLVREKGCEFIGNPVAFHLMFGLAPTSCLLLPRESFLRLGGFAPIPARQDFEFVLRWLENGWNVVQVPQALVRMKLHTDIRISTHSKKSSVLRSLRIRRIRAARHYGLFFRERLRSSTAVEIADELTKTGRYVHATAWFLRATTLVSFDLQVRFLMRVLLSGRLKRALYPMFQKLKHTVVFRDE